MNATETRLKFEMEDARRNLDWLEKQTAHLQELRRENYRNYYRAKSELKTLNDKK